MKTNIDKFISKIIPFLVVVLVAYVINIALSFYLPKTSIDKSNEGLNLTKNSFNGLYENDIKKELKENSQKLSPKIVNETLKEFTLNAIYYLNDNSGWIILIKRNGDTVILEKDEEVNGYKLVSLFKNHVIFEKNNKEFKLVLDESIKDIEPIIETIREVKKETTKSIENKDGLVAVNRNYLNNYISNIDKIWQDIAIKEIRKNRIIDGFEILNIKRGSDFEKLGLKKGDIIKSVNSKELKSYADAFAIYNNIKEINYLNIEIIRNNNTMELNYEIN